MSIDREDTAMRSHELIHGRTDTTSLARQRLHGDATPAWVIDPHMKATDLARTAARYACTASEIEAMLMDLVSLVHAQAAHPDPGAPVTVTVLDASDVLVDRRNRSLVERALQMAGGTGVRFRMVVAKPHIGWLGGSELIRSAMTAGAVFAAEEASV